MRMGRMKEILYEQEHERQRKHSGEAWETEYFLPLKTRWLEQRVKESEGFEGQSRQMSQKVLGCQVCDDFS